MGNQMTVFIRASLHDYQTFSTFRRHLYTLLSPPHSNIYSCHHPPQRLSKLFPSLFLCHFLNELISVFFSLEWLLFRGRL